MLPPSSPKHLGRHDHGRRHDQQLLLLLGPRRPRPIMRKSPLQSGHVLQMLLIAPSSPNHLGRHGRRHNHNRLLLLRLRRPRPIRKASSVEN